MSKPEISVVIPVYNQENYIEEAVLSVLGQEGVDFEVIAVNDGSRDRSGEILKKFSDRIRIIDQENQGVAMARNKGVQNAAGELIALLDHDDLYLPGHLRQAVEFANQHPEAIVFYGNAWLIDSAGNKLWVQKSAPRVSLESLVIANPIIPSSAIIRKILFAKGEYFQPRGPADDWDLWFRALELGPLLHYPWLGAAYRKHPASAIHYNQLQAEAWVFKILEAVFSRHPELDEKVKKQALANAYYESMVRFLAAGKGREARSRAIACLGRDPTNFKALTGLMLSAAPQTIIEAAVSLRRKILKWLA